MTNVWTIKSLIEYCTSRMKPLLAGKTNDLSLCVSELVTCIEVNGVIRDLSLVDGRWAAIYIRVSTKAQRSRGSGMNVADGFSEEDQILRNITRAVENGWAMRVYSDAGISSTNPPNKPDLLTLLIRKKADRYKKVFETVMLDPAHLAERTPDEIKAMHGYLDARVQEMMGALVLEDDNVPFRGRRSEKVHHRPALTALWDDMETDNIHVVVQTDKSRLVRDADLEIAILELAQKHRVALVGTVESIINFDITNEREKGMVYFLASMTEGRLTEVKTNAMRGYLQLLRSGRPNVLLPFWLRRDADGFATTKQELVQAVQAAISLFLDGHGYHTIQKRLQADGYRVDGKPITIRMIALLLTGTEIAGYQTLFGIRWPVFPAMVDEETLDDLAAERKRRHCTEHFREGFGGRAGNQANHVFTGLARCSCGYRAASVGGYLQCRRRDREGRHACCPEARLLEFMDQIIPHLGHLVQNSAGKAEADGATKQRQEMISVLNAEIAVAQEALQKRRQEAMETAKQSAASLNISPSHENFQTIIADIAAALVGTEVQALAGLQTRLRCLQDEALADRATARLQAALDDLSNWENYDTRRRNKAMRAIFDRITITPNGRDGSITFRLKGVDVDLPPVPMVRPKGAGSTILLASAERWIAEMFGLPYEEPEAPRPLHINSGIMISFLKFIRRYKGDDAIGVLAAAVRADPECQRRRYSSKEGTRQYLALRGFTEEVLEGLDAAWEHYLKTEGERLSLKLLQKGHTTEEIQVAWERYLTLLGQSDPSTRGDNSLLAPCGLGTAEHEEPYWRRARFAARDASEVEGVQP